MLNDFIYNVRKAEKTIGKGKKVKVVKGRKVPIGTIGECFWIKKVNYDRYNRWYNETTRIGIKDSKGNVYWTDANNCEVIIEHKKPVSEIVKEYKRNRSIDYLRMKKTFCW